MTKKSPRGKIVKTKKYPPPPQKKPQIKPWKIKISLTWNVERLSNHSRCSILFLKLLSNAFELANIAGLELYCVLKITVQLFHFKQFSNLIIVLQRLMRFGILFVLAMLSYFNQYANNINFELLRWLLATIFLNKKLNAKSWK